MKTNAAPGAPFPEALALLAAGLGINDRQDLLRVVDESLDDPYNPPGRRAVLVPIHAMGKRTPEPEIGTPILGDDAQVHVDASVGDQHWSEDLALADLWRLPHDVGATLESVEPLLDASAVIGYAEQLTIAGVVMAALWDLRKTPVALLQDPVFQAMYRGGGESGRVRRSARELGWPNGRAIAASAAQEYMTEQESRNTDAGLAPLWWAIAVWDGELTTIAASAPPFGLEAPRLSAIRTRVAGELGLDVEGTKRGRNRPRPIASMTLEEYNSLGPEGLEQLHAEQFRSSGPKVTITADPSLAGNHSDDTEVDDDDAGIYERAVEPSPGKGRIPTAARDRKERLSWTDKTGADASALADGERTLAQIFGQVFVPGDPATNTAIGAVLKRLTEAGLTDRQAIFLANAEAGFTHADIATVFKVSPRTVENTIRSARCKLGSGAIPGQVEV